MFDFAWSEIALIGVVALVAIGPKDLPVAIKAVAGMVKKARRMAAEFQTHVDELVKEADLQEVRDQFNQIRNFDFRGHVEKAVDSDGALRRTLASNPLAPAAARAPDAHPLGEAPAGETRLMERPEQTIVPPEGARSRAQELQGQQIVGAHRVGETGSAAAVAAEPPAFIPPAATEATLPAPAVAPAFIPPEYAAPAAQTP